MAESVVKPAILVLDMINDYLSPGGKLVCEPCGTVVPAVRSLLAVVRARGWPVFFVNTLLQNETTPLARKWGMHAEPGSWGAKVIDELSPMEGEIVVHKTTYDGFYETELEEQLRRLEISHLLISGIHTHVCVLLTALGAFYRGFEVIVIEDCITTEKYTNHESRLPFFRSHVGQLLPAEQALARFPSS